jgi:hypothetical protein
VDNILINQICKECGFPHADNIVFCETMKYMSESKNKLMNSEKKEDATCNY